MVVCLNIKLMFQIFPLTWYDRKMLPVELCDLGFRACSSWKSSVCIQMNMNLMGELSSQSLEETGLSPVLAAPLSSTTPRKR